MKEPLKKAEEISDRFELKYFFSPHYVEEKFHLDKNDREEVRNSFAAFNVHMDSFLAFLTFVLGIVYLVRFFLAVPSDQNVGAYIAQYPYSFAGSALLTVGSLLVLAYVITTTLLRAKENGLNRLCNFFFPFFLAIAMTLYLISDAKSGDMSHAGAISPAIFWLAIIAVTQEAAFVDNLILISFTALDTFIAITVLNAFYPIAEIHQYYILSTIYFFSALFLHNLFYTFFCQERYIETRNKELSAQAIYDPLTYCQNRAGLAAYLKRLPASNKTMALVMFDIDSFKLYNDQFSHKAGDEVLRKITQAVKDLYLNEQDSLPFFRYGGDEFLLFYDISDEKTLANELGKLKRAIIALDLVAPKGAPAPYCTVSIGAVFFSTFGSDFDSIFTKVDASLYNSKNFGKNHISIGNKIIDPDTDQTKKEVLPNL